MAQSQEALGYILLTGVAEKEDGQFVSYCPELGTSSCGDTVDEALANLGEAIEVHLDALEEVGTLHDVLRERHIRIDSGPPPSEELLRVPSEKIITSYRRPVPVVAI